MLIAPPMRFTMRTSRQPSWRIASATPRDGEHRCAEIDGYYFGSGSGETECDVARAATHIERAFTALHIGHLDQATFPRPVEAEALQIVDEVVARRDAGEEVIHLFA